MSQSSLYDLAVIDNVPFGLTGTHGRFFALRLERPGWKSWAPGQFVMIRPQGWALDMPWARPFSICRVSTNELVIFFQVSGRGTEKMAALRRGDRVHLWGPLGQQVRRRRRHADPCCSRAVSALRLSSATPNGIPPREFCPWSSAIVSLKTATQWKPSASVSTWNPFRKMARTTCSGC